MDLEVKLSDDSDDRDDLSELVADDGITPIETPHKQSGSLDINQTLAEMSYLEALDRLSNGDRFGAMERLKEACSYAPENQEYRTKLNQLLKEEADAKKKEIAKKTAKKSEEVVQRPEALEMKPATKYLRQPNSQTPRFITYEEVGLVSKPRVSLVDKIVLVVIGIVLVGVGIFLAKKKDVVIDITLVSPVKDVRVEQDDIEFFWEAKAQYFLLTIDSSSDRVIEVYTEETHYKPTPSELAKLQPNNSYKWKVIPVDLKRNPLPSKVDEFWFEVVK